MKIQEIFTNQDLYPGSNGYVKLPEDRVCVLYPTVTGGGRFLIGHQNDSSGGDEEYMFETHTEAAQALLEWDGYGEPPYWIRHTFKNQVRRRNSVTGKITVDERY